MSKFKSSVVVYQDFTDLIKNSFTEEIFKKFFERVSHSFPIDEDEIINEKEIAAFYFKTNQRINFLYDLALTYSEKYLENNELNQFLFHLAVILKLYHKNDLAIKLLVKVISRTGKIDKNKHLLATCDLTLAEVYAAEAQWKDTDRHLKISRHLFEELNDYSGVAECEFLYGSVFLEKGDLIAAIVRFENSEKYLLKTENNLLKAKLTNNRGIVNSIKGNFEESKKSLKEALVTFEALNLLPFQSEVKLNLGIIAFRQKDYDTAERHFDDAKILAIRSLAIQIVAVSMMYKANVLFAKGANNQSLKMIEQAKAISYQINDTLTVADLFRLNGIVSKSMGKHEVAEDMLLTSLRINSELGNQLNFAETSAELGDLYKILKKNEQAKFHFSNALKYYSKIEAEREVKELTFEINSINYSDNN